MKGIYMMNGQILGTVEDFDPGKWYGKVTLRGMEDMAEYGTLEPGTEVIVEGVTYKDPRK